MRFAGAVLFLAGGAGTAFATWAMYHHPRPRDVAFAVLAPVTLIIALTGLLLCFVPGFFS